MKTGDTMSQEKAAHEAALRWHVRLNAGDASVDDWHAFTLWLEADPAHNETYDSVALAWDAAGDALPANRANPAPQQQTGPKSSPKSSNVIAFPVQRLRRAVAARPLAYSGGFGAAIAASLLILVAPVFTGRNANAGFTPYATGIGEQRTITLADGSSVMLNTNTALSVKLGKGARQVRMQHGEAFFTVHHDSARPFKVALNGYTVTDVGTRFDVRLEAAGALVSVTEGLVDIAPAGVKTHAVTATTTGKRLGAGQQAVLQQGAKIHLTRFNAARTTAWHQGQLIFENDDLGKVAAELNRYFKQPVKLADNGLARLQFSGVLQIGDQNRAIDDLTAFLPIVAQKTPTGILLRRKEVIPHP